MGMEMIGEKSRREDRRREEIRRDDMSREEKKRGEFLLSNFNRPNATSLKSCAELKKNPLVCDFT